MKQKHPKPWRVVSANELVKDLYDGKDRSYETYEDAIVDANGYGVLEATEGLIQTDVLPFIVKCVNESIYEWET